MESKGFLLFDIDGVIRDVTHSYRLSIKETVYHFCKLRPSIEEIDDLKAEGCWNNDWDLSLELIKRKQIAEGENLEIPSKEELIRIFNNFYFGLDVSSKEKDWKGFINNERVLVDTDFFQNLTDLKITFGFVSGAERSSINYLFKKIGLVNPPLIAMGEAPEKPDPAGLIDLLHKLVNNPLSSVKTPIAYVGDTVADVLTVKNAKKKLPSNKLISIAVAPPHLHIKSKQSARLGYERNLKDAGADYIIKSTNQLIKLIPKLIL